MELLIVLDTLVEESLFADDVNPQKLDIITVAAKRTDTILKFRFNIFKHLFLSKLIFAFHQVVKIVTILIK